MYEACFKLSRRPFPPAPDTRSYFPATAIEQARQTLERVIVRGEGPGLVIGPPGTGKTLLCQLLARRFQETLAVAHLASGRLKTCQGLLQAILYELRQPCRGMDEGELRLELLDLLEPKADSPEALLLLVDEAHTLPLRLLDEIRLITNLVRDGVPRVRVVLAGGASLEERFASPKLSSFSQRIAGRCYLDHLDREETAAYVSAQLTLAGGNPDTILNEEAQRSIYRATDGIPRLINQLCDHALLLSALGGHTRLSAAAIDEAWADLQQLPIPWSAGQVREGGGAHVVEFGQLRDDADALPEAIPFRANTARGQEQGLHLATPDEQIEVIAGQLAEMEANSVAEPAESEVDLDFPEFGDPFAEEYDEEEVIVDPYRQEYEIFAEVPRVSSWEGRQIGAMLPETPWGQTTPEARLATPHAAAAELPIESSIEASVDWLELDELDELDELELEELDEAAELEDEFSPAADPVLPEETMPAVNLPETCQAVAPPVAEPVRMPVPMTPPANVPAVAMEPRLKPSVRPVSEKSPLVAQSAEIVVEDEVRAVPARPRSGEFRQLFAKLRRG